jgi:hypothetical protein
VEAAAWKLDLTANLNIEISNSGSYFKSQISNLKSEFSNHPRPSPRNDSSPGDSQIDIKPSRLIAPNSRVEIMSEQGRNWRILRE